MFFAPGDKHFICTLFRDKLEKNNLKYPVAKGKGKGKGNAKKYNEL